MLECWNILTLALKIPSGEGCGSLPVPGHWRGNEKPFTEVRAGSRLLLLPGLCGGRQPGSGHASPTAAGHSQEAGPAGDPRLCLLVDINAAGQDSHKNSTLHTK